jgi:hypothetical protein
LKRNRECPSPIHATSTRRRQPDIATSFVGDGSTTGRPKHVDVANSIRFRGSCVLNQNFVPTPNHVAQIGFRHWTTHGTVNCPNLFGVSLGQLTADVCRQWQTFRVWLCGLWCVHHVIVFCLLTLGAGRFPRLQNFIAIVLSGAILFGNGFETVCGLDLKCLSASSKCDVHVKGHSVDFKLEGCEVAHGVCFCLFDVSKIRTQSTNDQTFGKKKWPFVAIVNKHAGFTPSFFCAPLGNPHEKRVQRREFEHAKNVVVCHF